MLIYRGKLDWFSYAVNEGFTMVPPEEWGYGGTIYCYWQWTELDDGSKKVNNPQTSTINGVSVADSGATTFSWTFGGYYTLQTTISDLDTKYEVGSKLTIATSNPQNDTSSFDVTVVSNTPKDTFSGILSSYRIYVGKLSWYEYAVNEMIVIVIPDEVETDAPICAFWQWTVTSSGEEKENVDCVTTIEKCASTDSGEDITFDQGGYYTLVGSTKEADNSMALSMSNPNGDTQSDMPLMLDQSAALSSRTKRATVGQSTTTIYNNAQDTYYAIMDDSSEGGIARTLAAISMVVAVIGFPPVAKVVGAGVKFGVFIRSRRLVPQWSAYSYPKNDEIDPDTCLEYGPLVQDPIQ